MKIKTLTRHEAQKQDMSTIESGCAQTPKGIVTLLRWQNQIIGIESGGHEQNITSWAQDIMDTFFNKHVVETPILLIGTQFQTDVWKALAKVKWGETITYGQLAAKAGYPGASRAVGTAMNKNPISLLIPCHRVLAGGNKIGGYGGGLAVKKQHLDIEGVLKTVRP